MKKILVITPSLSGGSWVATQKILNSLSDSAQISVLGLGKKTEENNKLRIYDIPYPKYESWGAIHSKNPLMAMIWNLPLSLGLIFLFLVIRPSLVISNGFSSSLIFSPFIKMIGANFIVLYHGNILGFMSNKAKKVVKYLSKYVDLIVVNSVGSKNDIKQLFSQKKIIINEHFADEIFFNNPKRKKTQKKLVILYVGSLNKEKIFLPLVEIARILRANNNFKFVFVGRGRDQSEIVKISKESRNVSYLGYIGDRRKMKKIYDKADVLWSCADETYLAMPATEALASRVPVLIPKYPGLHQKDHMKITISEQIVPKKIGWLLDTNDINKCLLTVKKIQREGISDKMRDNCYDYAKLKYSPSNLTKTIDKIIQYL